MAAVSFSAQTMPAPLEAGDHLDQVTFHARYLAMPSAFHAELVGGVCAIAAISRARNISRFSDGMVDKLLGCNPRDTSTRQCHHYSWRLQRATAGWRPGDSRHCAGVNAAQKAPAGMVRHDAAKRPASRLLAGPRSNAAENPPIPLSCLRTWLTISSRFLAV